MTTQRGLRELRHAILINVSYPTRINGRGTLDVPEMKVGAATLPLLAALVRQLRPGCRIRMYDEIGSRIDFDHLDGLPREHTLVMISVRTSVAYEGRELSLRLQREGFTVVLGGPHPSACLDEVASYANGAVHGEAEVHMASLIDAFESGAMTARTVPGLRFKSDQNADLTRSPVPEFELYRHSTSYMQAGTLEFSRGCQYRCTFCASTNLYTERQTHKTNEQVLAEIERLPAYPGGRRVWFFGDDNFATSHSKAIDLCQAIGARYPKAQWGCAMTIASAGDKRLLDAMVAGGMRYVFIGFDSIVQDSLTATQKAPSKAAHFQKLIDNMKERGIFIVAALVFGFDHDRPTVFEDTLRWAEDSGVDILNLNAARPYPSSPMYADLKRQGRLTHDPWWLMPLETRLQMVHGLTNNLAGVMTTYQPRHMSQRDLAEGTLWVGQQFYRARRTLPRLLGNAKGPTSLFIDALTNYFYAREYQSFVDVGNPARSALPPELRLAS